MTTHTHQLTTVFNGWDGYHISIVRAVAPLTADQLAWQPAPHLRSAGEIARHIADARLSWLRRTIEIRNAEIDDRVTTLRASSNVEKQPDALVKWLDISWQKVEAVLNRWTIVDLAQTFPLTYRGQNYALPAQWILWRLIAHDLHHGGELSFVLGMQGISLPDLGDNGGHVTEPPLAEQA